MFVLKTSLRFFLTVYKRDLPLSMSILLTCLILFNYWIKPSLCDFNTPPGFKFGVATASYQVEGAWDADGKGENIWDRFTHTHPEKITDHSTGDIACDSYHHWEEDINIIKDIGVDFYRFSISWSRILPTGFPNKVNPAGVQYYNNIIDRLIENGIEPVITLFHWDLPQTIQDLGGWTNYQTADYFADFARVAFRLFGDRVKTWITLNEPYSICVAVYELNNGAPNITSPGIGSYLCGKAQLLAHAKAYQVYQNEFKNIQKGLIGITIDSNWAEPASNNQTDIDAANREMQMSFGWYAHPIFSKQGDYPLVMKSRIANLSLQQNFTSSRLPSLSVEEIQLIQGSADFLGLNHYNTFLTSNKEFDIDEISFFADKGTSFKKDPNWSDPDIVPMGFRKLMNWVKDQYDNPLVYITENGIGDTTGTLNDTRRIQYLQEYFGAVLDAINIDGCNITRYTVWSVLDNMEWTDGYTIKYGLYHVDFNDPKRTRTPKESVEYYKSIISGARN